MCLSQSELFLNYAKKNKFVSGDLAGLVLNPTGLNKIFGNFFFQAWECKFLNSAVLSLWRKLLYAYDKKSDKKTQQVQY